MSYKKLLPVLLFMFIFSFSFAQGIYRSSGGEIILSMADVEQNGKSIDMNPRFTAFFHFQELWNFDVNDNIGFFSGAAMRNVGFITEPNDSTKIKRRAYALGAPVGVKLGSFRNSFFFFAGAEPEWMFHFKEKTFIHGDKSKRGEWLSDEVNMFNPSVFAGIQFPGSMNVKFKYYLNDFMNQDFVGTQSDGTEYKPYDGLKSQVFYISVGFNVYARKN